MNTAGTMRPTGTLTIKADLAKRPPLSWRLRNVLRWSYFRGWLAHALARPIGKYLGIITITSQLEAILFKADGSRINYGVLSRRVITDTGVGYIVDDWDNSATDITNFNYHGVGTGAVAEAAGDTALGAESTTILNPDSTRATGTKSQPAANQLRSIGTVTFDGAGAITEHGILSQAATGGGVLWDRSVFSAINVVSGDSIQFTYTATLTSGG